MKTNYVLLVLLSVFFFTSSSLQAQTTIFEWARGMGSSSWDVGHSITTDPNGNVYAVGAFSYTVDFDPGAATANLTSAGATDIYIQKTDVIGNLIWAKRIGGFINDFAYSITYDGNGNLCIAGYFQGTVDFDPGSATSNLTAAGGYDIFVLKIDTSGNFMWAKRMGGTADNFGVYITSDTNGNIFTTGDYQGTADFDPGSGITNLTSNGGRDIFIQKLDANGNFLWAKSMGGTGDDKGFSVTTDANGNVYTVGNFTNNVDFDPGVGTTNATSYGFSDIFIQKLDATGNFIWVKRYGGTGSDDAVSITSDFGANIYVSGSFQDTVYFDSGPGTSDLISAGSNDIFVLKLDLSSNVIWVKQMGGTGNDQAYETFLDAMGNLYTTGRFSDTVDFDPGLETTNLTSVGGVDVFIHKMDTSGIFHWAKSIGGTGSENGNDITTDGNGNVYTTGAFQLTADFDPGPGTSNLNSVGSYDIFIHKMSQCLMTTATDLITACDSYTWIDGNTYTASNNTAMDTILNAGGCDSIVTLDLTINSVSDITTTLAGTTITANNAAATYVWLDCDNDNTPIAGETNQTFTPTNNGNYAVELAENGCADTSACVVVTIVGIIESSLSDFLNVHPNPTKGTFSINFGSNQESLTVKVFSISGQVLHSQKFQNTNSVQLELNQPTGIYMLEITDAQNNRAVLKLMKE